jgi:hypothetical protein
MTEFIEHYEEGLNQAKRIMAYMAKMNLSEIDHELFDGWAFINFLVREAEKEYEDYKRSLR